MRTNRRASKDILTLNGKVRISRNILIPADPESVDKLWKQHHLKSVVPLDEVLGIDKLTFKMSVDLMLECAFWAQNQSSYEAAEQAMERVHGLKINDDTIRMVANEIGRIVFEEDCRQAEASLADFDACRIPFKKDREGVLYIECDGAALNTRHQNEQGSSWRENKLGIVFSTQDIKYYRNARTGVRQHRIERREYVAFIGGVEQFKKHRELNFVILPDADRLEHWKVMEAIKSGSPAKARKAMHQHIDYIWKKFPNAFSSSGKSRKA